MNRFQKSCAIAFILWCLWGQIVNNTYLQIPFIPYFFKQLAAYLGTGTYWQMFSIADRYNWRMEWVAIHQNKQSSLIPIPYQTNNGFLQDNLIEFREGKLNQTLFSHDSARRYYVNYICRVYQDEQNPILGIRVDLYWQRIIPPNQAKIRGEYLTAEFSDPGKLGYYKCR